MLRILDFVVENFDIISVKNLDVTRFELRHLAVVKLRRFILEKAVATTHTATVLLLRLTTATLLAILDRLVNRIGELKWLLVI